MPEEIKKIQTSRYTDDEEKLLKRVFKNNAPLLKTIEKFLFQIPLTAIDLSLLEITFKNNKELSKLMRKMLYPQLTDDVPYREMWDLWAGIDFKGIYADEAVLRIKSNKRFLDYLDQQLTALENADYTNNQKIKFAEFTEIEDKLDADMYMDIFARNTVISVVQNRLNYLEAFANAKEETPEERAIREKKDSAK